MLLQRAFGAGLTFLLAMLIKLVPQKLGDSVVLTKAGLNHFWESLLTFLVVLPVFLGKFLSFYSLQQILMIILRSNIRLGF